MRIGSTVRIALRALRRNKMRTLLTMLGIIIGVGAVIAMVGIGTGAKAQVEAQIASLGENVILIFSGSITSSGIRTGWGGAGTLTVDDAEAIGREVPGVIAVSPEVRGSRQIQAGNQNWFTMILGAGPDYFQVRQWPLKEGTVFSETDVRGATKVAVIGQTTARQLFGEESPVGKIVRLKTVPFQILGVLAPKGLSVMGTDQDDVLIVPYTSAMKRVLGGRTFRSINVQAENDDVLPLVQQQIVELLRQRHRVTEGKEEDFTVRSQEEIAQAATQTTQVLTILLGSIAGVSLLVGGIGIMNIMLVSVTERTREIGIRMAVGARGKDILAQFLIEAITLSSLGGAIGVLLGVGVSQLLAHFANWPSMIPAYAIVGAFMFSGAIGVFFGYYPARKAAALDPIEALRYE